MLLFTTVFLVAITLYPSVNGQYFSRPYQMAIHNGFSPYHPARINHETLPISQAEFAQLVAESMATSRGPHHHHPPNTDADYEGPDHAAHDAEMMRSASGESHYGNHQQNHHTHNHHRHSPHQSSHNHHHSHGTHSQYQPDVRYPDNEESSYHRSAVFEQAQKQQQEYEPAQQEEDDDDDVEGDEQYGGRPTSAYHATSGFEGQRNGYMNNYEEDSPSSRDQYMSASEQVPIKIIPLKN